MTKKMAISSIKKACEVLAVGGVIVHATETCYGFACDATSKKALQRLYALKKMPRSKPISIFVAELKIARRYGIFNKKGSELAQNYWPGPLTIVVKRKKNLPSFINPKNKTVGFRVPGHQLSLSLARAFKKPLTTTSANISGLPSPYSVSAIKKQFKDEKMKPDFIIDSGKIAKNPPSTIIDVSKKKIEIIRQGSLQVSLD